MNEVVLVSGSESLTGRKLVEKLLARGCRVVAAVAGKGTETSKTDTEKLTVFTWNRASWFSTKTVVRETLRLFHRIDAAWILHGPTQNFKPFAEIGTSDIEEALEQTIKGSIALARELLFSFNSTDGFMGMVLPHSSGGPDGTMAALTKGAFIKFTGAFIKEAEQTVWACGMQSSSPDADGFTSAMLRLWDEKPAKLRGRWYRHRDRQRLFKNRAFSDSIR